MIRKSVGALLTIMGVVGFFVPNAGETILGWVPSFSAGDILYIVAVIIGLAVLFGESIVKRSPFHSGIAFALTVGPMRNQVTNELPSEWRTAILDNLATYVQVDYERLDIGGTRSSDGVRLGHLRFQCRNLLPRAEIAITGIHSATGRVDGLVPTPPLQYPYREPTVLRPLKGHELNFEIAYSDELKRHLESGGQSEWSVDLGLVVSVLGETRNISKRVSWRQNLRQNPFD